MIGIIGRKIGMTRVFDDAGKSVPVTVVVAGPCSVTQIKTEKTDGYDSVQIGFLDKKEKNTSKAELKHFAKAGVKPKKVVKELKGFAEAEKLKLGDSVTVEIFEEGEGVSVTGFSSQGFHFPGKLHIIITRMGSKNPASANPQRRTNRPRSRCTATLLLKGLPPTTPYHASRLCRGSTLSGICVLSLDG